MDRLVLIYITTTKTEVAVQISGRRCRSRGSLRRWPRMVEGGDRSSGGRRLPVAGGSRPHAVVGQRGGGGDGATGGARRPTAGTVAYKRQPHNCQSN